MGGTPYVSVIVLRTNRFYEACYFRVPMIAQGWQKNFAQVPSNVYSYTDEHVLLMEHLRS